MQPVEIFFSALVGFALVVGVVCAGVHHFRQQEHELRKNMATPECGGRETYQD